MDTVQSPMRMPVIEGVATHCRYQEPGSTMTLAEGLAEYYATNDNLFKPEQMANDPSIGTLASSRRMTPATSSSASTPRWATRPSRTPGPSSGPT